MKKNHLNRDPYPAADWAAQAHNPMSPAHIKNEDASGSGKRKRKRKWVDRLLLFLIIVCLAGAAYFLIKPIVVKHRQDEVTSRLNEQFDAGDLSSIKVKANANKVEGESYDFYGEGEINYDDLDPNAEVELVPLGRLKIPSIHVNLPLLDKAWSVQLRYGLGHVPESALPGEDGNCAILGHRMLDSGRHLNRLNEVKIGDQFTINTGTDLYTYEVIDMPVIEPEVLMDYVNKNYGMPTVTLITCHPIPTWTHRLLCIGKQIDHQRLEPKKPATATASQNNK